jgi:hypothetical protein
MLFCNVPNMHSLAVAVHEGHPENTLTLEDAFRVVAQGPVPKVGKVFLGGIEPTVRR